MAKEVLVMFPLQLGARLIRVLDESGIHVAAAF